MSRIAARGAAHERQWFRKGRVALAKGPACPSPPPCARRASCRRASWRGVPALRWGHGNAAPGSGPCRGRASRAALPHEPLRDSGGPRRLCRRGCRGRDHQHIWCQLCQVGGCRERWRGLLGRRLVCAGIGCSLRGCRPRPHGAASRAHGSAALRRRVRPLCRAGSGGRRSRCGPFRYRDHGRPCRGEGRASRRAREL